jgi:hypothetical protein
VLSLSAKQTPNVLTLVILAKVGCVGWSFTGGSLRSSLHVPNSNPSQAMFDPDEPKLIFVWTDSPRNVTLAHWDWTFAIFGVMLKLRLACVSLTLSLGKVSPSPSNVGLLDSLANFNCDAEASASPHFLELFSSEKCHLRL